MIVDTNILLRLIDGPDAPQNEQAARLVRNAREAEESLVVTEATFIEVGFVLQGPRAGYGWEVGEVAGVLLDLLETVPFTFERTAVLRRAVAIYRATGFDLHDCYLQARAEEADDEVLSLNGDFKRM